MDWLIPFVGLGVGTLLVYVSTQVEGPWYLSIPSFCLGILMFGLGIAGLFQ